MLKIFYVREMIVRSIEESRDRIVYAPDRATAIALYCNAVAATEGDIHSVDELPPVDRMGVVDLSTMRLIERI